MATIAARPTRSVRVSAPLVITMVLALAVGVVAGYGVAPRATAAAPSAQVAEDNAWVDRWDVMHDSGSRADLDALARPNIQFVSSAGFTTSGADELWSLIGEARRDNHVHTRTTDVVRIGTVIVWGGQWIQPAFSGDTGTAFVRMAQFGVDGRIFRMYEVTR